MKLIIIALEKENNFSVLKLIYLFIHLPLFPTKFKNFIKNILATILLHTTQSKFSRGVITSANNLEVKVKME